MLVQNVDLKPTNRHAHDLWVTATKAILHDFKEAILADKDYPHDAEFVNEKFLAPRNLPHIKTQIIENSGTVTSNNKPQTGGPAEDRNRVRPDSPPAD